MGKKKKTESVARGYRLRPETHSLIKQLKENMGISHDKILNDALISFYFLSKKNQKGKLKF